MGSGFGFGLLMTQLYIMARHVDLFVELMDCIHVPAFFIADVIANIMDWFHRLGGANTTSQPINGLPWPAALNYVPSGIVIEWTLLGALTGIVWSMWKLHGIAKSK
jgi:hypothetical protein